MATLGSNVLTMADWAKRFEDGKLAKIIELLSQNNQILDDMPFKEANQATGHITTLRTSLPSVSWRRINEGVTPSKSTANQITEGTAMLEAWSEVDVELANLSGDVNGFRLTEAAAFIEAMSQEMASTVIYGNQGVNPEEFNGLDVRYGATSGTNGQNIVQVGSTVGGGGSGSDNASIWLVVWGESTVHGIFPKGSKAGITHEDKGKVVVETTAGIAGSRMEAYLDKFAWKTGLALRDWRYVARIPNIDISNLTSKTGAADLFELMVRAGYRVPNVANGKACYYANRTCMQMLDIQKRDNVQLGGQLTYDDHDGKPVMKFRGIPVRLTDALTETESAIA